MVGRMFQEFAVTVTVSIAVSALAPLTLTPMGARLLWHDRPEAQRRLPRGLERCFDGLPALDDRGLVVAPRHRCIATIGMLTTGLGGMRTVAPNAAARRGHPTWAPDVGTRPGREGVCR